MQLSKPINEGPGDAFTEIKPFQEQSAAACAPPSANGKPPQQQQQALDFDAYAGVLPPGGSSAAGLISARMFVAKTTRWWAFAGQSLISLTILIFAVVAISKGGSLNVYLPILTAVVGTNIPSAQMLIQKGLHKGATSSGSSSSSSSAGTPPTQADVEQPAPVQQQQQGVPATAAPAGGASAPTLDDPLDPDISMAFARFMVQTFFSFIALVFVMVLVSRALDMRNQRLEKLPETDLAARTTANDQVGDMEAACIPIVMAIFGFIMPAPGVGGPGGALAVRPTPKAQ